MDEIQPVITRRTQKRARQVFYFFAVSSFLFLFVVAMRIKLNVNLFLSILFSFAAVFLWVFYVLPWCFKCLLIGEYFCKSCGKFIPTNIEWRCGYCDRENHDSLFYSFLNYCENCKAAPKAYICHHCGVSLYLDEDKDDSHPAAAISPPVEPESVDQARNKRAEAIAKKRDLITLSDLEAQLKESRARAKPPREKPKKSRAEILEESFQEKRGTYLGVDDIATREEKRARKDHRKNPEKLAQELAVIKQFRQDHIGEQ